MLLYVDTAPYALARRPDYAAQRIPLLRTLRVVRIIPCATSSARHCGTTSFAAQIGRLSAHLAAKLIQLQFGGVVGPRFFGNEIQDVFFSAKTWTPVSRL